MTVKEFFDEYYIYSIDKWFDRYLELYPVLESYEMELMTQTKIKFINLKYKEMFKNFLDNIHGRFAEKSDKVLFLVEQVPMFFDDVDRKELNSWFCYKKDIIEKCKNRITLWNSEESRIEHYAYDMSAIDEILSMELWKIGVDDTDAICEIMHEISFFGIDEDYRDKRIKEIHDELTESVRQVESGEVKTIPAEEVFRKLEEEIFQNASEEEKIEILKQREEDKKNKPRDDAYLIAAGNLNHLKCVESIYSYYINLIKSNEIIF